MPIKKQEKSNYCKSPVEVVGDGTMYYVCTKCNKSCDLLVTGHSYTMSKEAIDKYSKPNNDWDGREEIAKVIYSKELKNPLKVLEIEAIIKKEKEKSYLEGVKDGEGTKRYLMGFEAGKQETLREVRDEIQERLRSSKLIIEASEKGQDLEDGWTSQERIDHETSVIACLENFNQYLPK